MYGISLRTLRFYEDRGFLHPRRVGNARYYSASDKLRVELVLTGKRLGFTLAEISALLQSRESDVASRRTEFTETLSGSEIEKQIDILKQRRKALSEAIDELQRANARLAQHSMG